MSFFKYLFLIILFVAIFSLAFFSFIPIFITYVIMALITSFNIIAKKMLSNYDISLTDSLYLIFAWPIHLRNYTTNYDKFKEVKIEYVEGIARFY